MPDVPTLSGIKWHWDIDPQGKPSPQDANVSRATCDQCGWELSRPEGREFSELYKHAEHHATTHVTTTTADSVPYVTTTSEPPYSLDYTYSGIRNGWRAECKHCGTVGTYTSSAYSPLAELIMQDRWAWIVEHYSLHQE